MINFPINPQLNDEYTYGNKIWVFNGVGWAAKPAGISPEDLEGYALEQWVADNFALKQSGIIPPVSEVVTLTDSTPTYTVVSNTADNLNVTSSATSGSIILPNLLEDKAIKIQIAEGSNSITILGTLYSAGVTVFVLFDFDTLTWTSSSILDPQVPDYSDISVDQYTDTALVFQRIGYWKITSHNMGGTTAGNLIFVNNADSQGSIGIYQALENASGDIKASKLVIGTNLNTIRVKNGLVYTSQYDGYSILSLSFENIENKVDKNGTDRLVSSTEVNNWNQKQDGTTNNITPTASGGTYTILNNRVNNLRSVWLLAGTHNLNLATVSDNNIINEQYIIFRTGATVPTINFVQPYYAGQGTVAITNGSTSVTVAGTNASMVFKANQTFIANGVTYTCLSDFLHQCICYKHY